MRHGTLCAHDRYGGTDNRLVVCLVEDRAGDGAGLCRHGQNPDEQTQEDTEIASALHSILEASSTVGEKKALLDAMSGIEPFSAYHWVIEEIRKELDNEKSKC